MDPYSVLGVSRTDDNDTIKKKYKKLALQYHPDRNSSQEAIEKMQQINEAYDILCNLPKEPQNEMFHYNFNHGFQHPFFNHNFNNVFNIPTTNSYSCQTTISFQNGKRVETKIEIINGVQKVSQSIH